MKRSYTVPFTRHGIEKIISALDEYERWLEEKTHELVQRLANEGMTIAQFGFDIALYDGVKDVRVSVQSLGEYTAAVIATGQAVLFIEFGAGYLLGEGHPEPMGYGVGTYPGQRHAYDPNGWYLPKAVQEETGIKHSIGNPPSMAMYNTVKELEDRLQEIASEVFK